MKPYLNLIPIALRRRQLMVRLGRRWGIVCCCVVIIGSMLVSMRLTSRQKLHQQVGRLEQSCSVVREIARKSASAKTEISDQEDQLRWLRSHEQADVPLITLAAVHQSLHRLAERVRLDRLRFRGLGPGAEPARRDTRGAVPTPPRTGLPEPVAVDDEIHLSGSAKDDASVSALIRELESTGLFAEVELISLQIGSASATQFQVQCRIRAEVDQLQELAGQIPAGVTQTTAGRTTPDDQF